jgi:hypothetical protein
MTICVRLIAALAFAAAAFASLAARDAFRGRIACTSAGPRETLATP